jgi:site-specific DNA-cytosine methylase
MYLERRVVSDFQDFSLFGSGQGLQGATIKNLLVFLKSIKQSRPHVLVHENVLGFPIETVIEQLQGFMSILTRFVLYFFPKD